MGLVESKSSCAEDSGAEMTRKRNGIMAHVTGVRAIGGSKLGLVFADGAQGTVDLASILHGPVFESLRNPSEFKKVRVNSDFGCVEWPNGVDLCPDALREDLVPGRVVGLGNNRTVKARVGMAKSKRARCKTGYTLKVRSKKTGRWEPRLFGCSLRSMKRASEFYMERFGKKAKIERGMITE